MYDLFWSCLIGGVLFALVTLLGGGRFHRGHVGHHALRFRGARFLNPTTVVGAVTAFGGAGILLSRYTVLVGPLLIAAAVAIALAASVAVHFGYVLPAERAETSLAFSVTAYVGRTGTVTVAIPTNGHGEAMVRMGAGNTCRTATGVGNEAIPTGAAVVVVEVQNGVLIVAPLEIS